jgi:CDC-like kinase
MCVRRTGDSDHHHHHSSATTTTATSHPSLSTQGSKDTLAAPATRKKLRGLKMVVSKKTAPKEKDQPKDGGSNDKEEERLPPPPVKVQDDEDGHLIYHKGDVLDSRYEVLRTLGEGTFGKVVCCSDRTNDKEVAVKIIKNVPKYRAAARIEIRVLKQIREIIEDGQELCVQLRDWFDYHGHISLTFDMLGLSVFDFLVSH